jgi:hypothetical protein
MGLIDDIIDRLVDSFKAVVIIVAGVLIIVWLSYRGVL